MKTHPGMISSTPGGTISTETAARQGARDVLSGSWREADGFCPPNPTVYPHQWLWDSCFQAIAWAALDDARAARELESCLSGALESGFVPHMRYLGPSSGRGPLAQTSSFTQPPIYAHAARYLLDRGLRVDTAPIEAGLDWLWDSRLTDDGLVVIVHPWESGSDDSPRWDSWVGLTDYDHAASSAWDRDLVAATDFDSFGAAVWSSDFVCAPAAFNSFVAHAAAETYHLTRDPLWERRSKELAAAIDVHLWDESTGLWIDKAIVGGGDSVTIPTLDGVLGALCTDNAGKAERALAHLSDPGMFGTAHGLAFVPPAHDRYDPNEYWRGPAWPQLNYMAGVAARRWGNEGLYRDIARKSVHAALESGFSEYWNPETGRGLGAIPQGWAALAATYSSEVAALEQRPKGEPSR